MHILEASSNLKLELQGDEEMETIIFVSSAYGARRYGMARLRYRALGRHIGKHVSYKEANHISDPLPGVILEPRDSKLAIDALQWYRTRGREEEGDFIPPALDPVSLRVLSQIEKELPEA